MFQADRWWLSLSNVEIYPLLWLENWIEVIEPVAADVDAPALLPKEAEDDAGARLSLLAVLDRFLSLSLLLLLLSLYIECPFSGEEEEKAAEMPSSEENVMRGSVWFLKSHILTRPSSPRLANLWLSNGSATRLVTLFACMAAAAAAFEDVAVEVDAVGDIVEEEPFGLRRS